MLQDLQIQTEASTNRLQDVRRRDPSNPALFYDIWKFMRGWPLWWWWWWLWWHWWWLVSLLDKRLYFWLLLRDKKMFFFTCILMQFQLVCQFRDDEDDDVNVHPVVFPSLPSPYPIMFLPRIPSPSHSTLPKIKKWLFTPFALYWQNLGSCFPLYFLSSTALSSNLQLKPKTHSTTTEGSW